MKALWNRLWLLCRLQGGPEEIPSSLELLLLIVMVNTGLGIGVQLLAEPVPVEAAVGMSLLALGLDVAALAGLLAFKAVKQRFVSTLTAIFGVDLIISLLALPVVVAGSQLPKTPWLAVMVFFQMLLVGWNLAIRGFIYHRTLRLGIFQANMLSLTLFLLTVFLGTRLFPELLPVAAVTEIP